EQVMRLAMIAADYTPGEADQLRRDMAAWHRTGRMERHRERLITRMQAKGIAIEFAERVFEQIRGFGEYGFPESHASSFALIAYATSWLRRHYLPEFTCSLLNAMPMGFYSAATIVGDAQRHGMEVRPIDVAASEWDCTLEAVDERSESMGGGSPAGSAGRAGGEAPRGIDGPFGYAVRMGLRWIKGLSIEEGARITAARGLAPFRDLEDLTRRTHLPTNAQMALAE